jgi:hypothetical protein
MGFIFQNYKSASISIDTLDQLQEFRVWLFKGNYWTGITLSYQ